MRFPYATTRSFSVAALFGEPAVTLGVAAGRDTERVVPSASSVALSDPVEEDEEALELLVAVDVGVVDVLVVVGATHVLVGVVLVVGGGVHAGVVLVVGGGVHAGVVLVGWLGGLLLYHHVIWNSPRSSEANESKRPRDMSKSP